MIETQCPNAERTALLADGELEGEAYHEALDHLVDCAACMNDFSDAMQILALAHVVRPGGVS